MEAAEKKILMDAELYAEELFRGESSGHGIDHTVRVAKLALTIAEKEDADLFAVALASLLHDADDVKLFPETAEKKEHAVSFMREHGLSESFIGNVVRIMDQVAFRGTDSVVPDTLEGKCVQDADRLDAIGAIGVARAFSYGGSRGRRMYDPSDAPKAGMDEEAYRKSGSNTVNHFYEKLFLLKGMMNTGTARRMAEERDRFMHSFMDEFMAEWNGER